MPGQAPRESVTHRPEIYRDVLLASVPIAITYGSTIAYETVALIFLSRYSDAAFAAIFPGFVVYFNLLMLPLGVVKYVRILMAGEVGRNQPHRVGQLLWLGLAVSGVAAALFALMAYYSERIFAFIGHSPELQALEAAYFRVMCCGVFFNLAIASIESMYLAIGRRRIILLVQLIAIVMNVALTPLLIFGWGGFPELGIQGAAYATVGASLLVLLIYCVLMQADSSLEHYRLLSAFRFTRTQLGTLLRIGVPSGVERAFEELTWTVLLLVIGRLGIFALTLSNVAINILELAYFPMIALGEVLSVQVARLLGSGAHANVPPLVNATLRAVLVYSVVWIVVVVAGADLIRGFYFADVDLSRFADVDQTFSGFFLILAFCVAVGPIYYVFNAILTALGDTTFPMGVMLVGFVFVFCIPLYVFVIQGGLGVLCGWLLFLINLTLLCFVNGFRYYFKSFPSLVKGM